MTSIQRCRAGVAGAAVLWIGLLAAPGQAREPRAEAELPYRALNVFQRHCLKCHGDAPKGGVRILDRALLVEQRQVVRPGSPETSELFDLVQGGSMPPGNCPKVPADEVAVLRNWIQAEAQALPGSADESYVLWSIVRDLRTRTEEDKRSLRYLSLNHLLGRESALRDLAQQRKTLERVFRDLVPQGKQPPDLRSIEIEPTGTIFRINLRDLGWDRPPYPRAKEPWNRLNLFDLLLLEYPHGRLPIGSPFYDDLLTFLRAAGQVRPVPYVRADWLAEMIVHPPLHRDFLQVLGKPPDRKPMGVGPVRPDLLGTVAIAAEWHGRERLADRPSRQAKPFLTLPVHHLRGGEVKERLAFRKGLAELLDGDPDRGLPIVPLDGLTYHPGPSADVEFRAIDFRQRGLADPPARGTPEMPFVPGDRMALWIKTQWDAVAEVIHTDLKSGRKFKPRDGDKETFECRAAKAIVLPREEGIRMELGPKEEEDKEEYTIYAYPRDDLKAMNADFPLGTLLRAEGVHDRVVHPLYKLQADGRGFEPPGPSKMVRVTITITTRRKKN